MLLIFRKIRIAVLLDKAFQETSYKQYKTALSLINKIEDLGLSRISWGNITVQIYLLKSLLQIRMAEHSKALELLIKVQEYLLGLREQTPEVLYLEVYAGILAREPLYSKELQHSDIALKGFELFRTPRSAVNLSRVPQHLKRKFPLPS